jgi:two-component system phosphate regulon sensor histidine kinase PhoR
MTDWILCGAFLALAALAFYYARRASVLRAALARQEAARRAEADMARAECERAARESASLRQEYEALLEECGAGALVLDAAGTILRANQTARRLLGAPLQTLTGKTLLQATLSDELDALFRTARKSLSVRQQEIHAPGSTGYALLVSLTPIAAGEAEPERYLLIAHNVTELRRLERIRRDFVANVSHELRTPLASIRAMAETLQDGAMEDAEVAGRFLNTIITETQRLTRIAEDLLILSDAETRAMEKTRFTLSGLIEEVVGRLRPQAEKTEITLTTEVPPGLDVFADPDQIEQVVVNLVDNAIKYTHAGGRVCVSAERRPDDIAVHVADTGIGIMSHDLPRIFERFYRVDKARSRQSGGTGLGLSIVKNIVEAHGGTVTVESEMNHGSTFTFTLPVNGDANRAEDADATAKGDRRDGRHTPAVR